MKKYLFIDFLSINKKEKSGLDQYHLKILLLILILEYAVTISLPTLNNFSHRGKERPTEPPSIFDSIPPGCLSSSPPKPRKTIFASCKSRNFIPDELEQFREADNLVYGDVIEKVRIHYDLIVFEQGPEIIIQPKEEPSGTTLVHYIALMCC